LEQNSEQSVAEYIFSKMEDFRFDNPDLERIFMLYRSWYEAGLQPTEKSFIYYPDEPVNRLVISLLEFPYELSPRWQEMLHGRQKDELEQRIQDSRLSIHYLQLRKLKDMLNQNQKELVAEKDPDIQRQLMEVHLDLKKYERELTAELGTVIVK
jgi:DNA primase